MSASSTVTVGVKANTAEARKSLADLDKEVQKMQQKADERQERQSRRSAGANSRRSGSASGSSAGIDIPGVGKVQGLSSAMKALGKVAAATGGSISGFSSIVGSLSNPVGLLAGGVSTLAASFKACVAAGAPAAAEFEKINVSLQTLATNLGSTESTAALAKDIQLLAANGVGNLDSLTAAAKTLMVAFEGNQSMVRSLLPVYDDIAAGIGISADQMAKLTARVQATGKVETEVINMMRDLGVPIYELLAEVMNTTGDAAREAAKKGEISAATWLEVVGKLHESYKGLSAELSGKTFEGAQATLDKMREMSFQLAAEANNAERIANANARAAEYNQERLDVVNQKNMETIGMISGKIGGALDYLWNDVLTLKNLAKGFMDFFTYTTGGQDRAAELLLTSSKHLEEMTTSSDRSAEDLAKIVQKMRERSEQIEATLEENWFWDSDIGPAMQESLKKIKGNLQKAEADLATAQAREAKQAAIKAAQEKKAAEDAAAADKRAQEAAKELAEAERKAAEEAKKEAEARRQHAKTMAEERLALAKDVREYANRQRQESARSSADEAARRGDSTSLEQALDDLAAAMGHDDITSATEKFAQLEDKLKNNQDEITRADLQQHEQLSRLLEEAKRFRSSAADAQTSAHQATESPVERAAREAAEELETYRDQLRASGRTMREQNALMQKKLQEMAWDAQKNLIEEHSYTDASGRTYTTDAASPVLEGLEKLATQEQRLAELEKRHGSEQLRAMKEASAIAKAQLDAITRINLQSKAH